jgi:hypothetical protein
MKKDISTLSFKGKHNQIMKVQAEFMFNVAVNVFTTLF